MAETVQFSKDEKKKAIDDEVSRRVRSFEATKAWIRKGFRALPPSQPADERRELALWKSIAKDYE